jgi:hypothetical protein
MPHTLMITAKGFIKFAKRSRQNLKVKRLLIKPNENPNEC